MAGHEPQHIIAHGVAKAIVEALEMVDIDHCQRQRSACANCVRLGLFHRRHQPAPVEHTGQRVGHGGPFGLGEAIGERPAFGSGLLQFIEQAAVGGLHGRCGGAQLFEQASQCGGIHWPGQALAAVGNGAAIIGQIGLAALDALGQGFGLAMGLRNQLVDLGFAHLAQQCFAQAHHRAQGEPVAGQGLVDGQGQFGILVAHVTP